MWKVHIRSQLSKGAFVGGKKIVFVQVKTHHVKNQYFLFHQIMLRHMLN